MTSPLLLHLDGIGPISFRHSRRARRFRITVKPSGVQVSVPRTFTLAQGHAFACAHRDWIGRHVTHMHRRLRAQADAIRKLPTISEEDARERLSARITELADRYGFTFSRLSIRRQKTRWGSCTHTGAISLNIALARLPRGLMDYVILHELVHTRIKGHGRTFWNELEKVHGQAIDHHRRLRFYNPEMMLAAMNDRP